jgi:hypothetical protein
MTLRIYKIYKNVILIAESAEELQKALDVTYNFFCKNHLKISQRKSNIMVFNKKAGTPMQTWTCGPLVLEEVSEYKYLGHVIAHNLTNKNNIQHKKGLIEAALAICLAVASDEILHHIKLDSLTELYTQRALRRCYNVVITLRCDVAFRLRM